MIFFQDVLDKPPPEMYGKLTILDFNEARDDRVAGTLAGLYTIFIFILLVCYR